MIFKRCIAAVVLLYAGSALAASPSLSLVQDGKPASAIVLADKPTKSARQAATELQSWLRKISGAKVPIVAEGRLPKEASDTLILVGDTSRTANLGLRST